MPTPEEQLDGWTTAFERTFATVLMPKPAEVEAVYLPKAESDEPDRAAYTNYRICTGDVEQCSTAQCAVDCWVREMRMLLGSEISSASSRDVLVWRRRPALERKRDYEHDVELWAVTGRFSIGKDLHAT